MYRPCHSFGCLRFPQLLASEKHNGAGIDKSITTTGIMLAEIAKIRVESIATGFRFSYPYICFQWIRQHTLARMNEK